MTFPLDDAYIALHSARFAPGLDPSFPGSQALDGATSPVHIALIKLALLVFSPLDALMVVTALGAVLYLYGVGVVFSRRTHSRWMTAAGVILAVLVGHSTFHLTSGLETGWAMAATIWTIAGVSGWLGILPWLRPDLAALSLVVGVARWRAWRPMLVGLCVSVALGIGYWTLTGHLVPHTAAAKLAVFGDHPWTLAASLPVFAASLRAFLWLVGPAALGALWTMRDHRDRWPLMAGLLVVLVLGLIAPRLIAHNAYRYLYPVLVPCCLVGFARAHRAAQVTLALALIWSGARIPEAIHDWQTNEAVVASLQPFADWLNTHDPHARVLVHDAGFLSETTSVELVDVIGLKTPAAVPLQQQFGLVGATTRLACATSPTYLVLYDAINEQTHLVDAFRDQGWIVTALLTTDGPAPWTYRLYRLANPANQSGRPPTTTAECGGSVDRRPNRPL